MNEVSILRQMLVIYKRYAHVTDMNREDQDNIQRLRLELAGGAAEDPAIAEPDTYNVIRGPKGSVIRTKFIDGKWHRAESKDGVVWPTQWSLHGWDEETDAITAGGLRG